MFRISKSVLFRFLAILVLVLSAVGSVVSAQQADHPWREVRTIHMADYGLLNVEGLTFSPEANAFLLWKADGSVAGIAMNEVPLDTQGLVVPADDPQNIAFNGRTNKLFVLGSNDTQLDEIPVDGEGLPAPQGSSVQKHNLDAVNLQSARGLTFDPATGRMFILNENGDQLVTVEPGGTSTFDGATALSEGRVNRFNLGSLAAIDLQGIAFNPQNGNLYFLDAGDQRLYEATQSGSKLSEFDLSSLQITNPKNIVFAPSADRTDDPNNQSLFILHQSTVTGSASPASPQPNSASGQIVELALAASAAVPPGTTVLPTTLVQIIDTSKAVWNPSAPDATGIDFWPQKGRLLIADSEVEEMPPYWAGKNVFELTTSGTQVSTCTTFTSSPTSTAWNNFSNEPTGLAINSENNHIFFSSDASGGRVFEVSLGPDGNYCTSDDIVTFVNTTNLYGSSDAEDVAYANNKLFVAGGVDAEVWMWDLGPNGVLGGGDDGPVTHFDTGSMGISDTEGLGYNRDRNTLLLTSADNNEDYVLEVTTSGTLLTAYDLSSATIMHKEDITSAPGSSNPSINNFYITDRGVDNNQNPNENDGKIWEVFIGNQPSVTITPSRTPTQTLTPTPTRTPTPTATRTPTKTPTLPPGGGGDTTGVFRPSNGLLYLKNRNDTGFADIALNYGLPGDYPVVGDWDGNGTTTIGIYRNGTFYLRNSNTNGFADLVFAFGIPGDQPVAGDWNGDGVDTIGVYRSSTGQFLLRNSNSAGAAQMTFSLGNVGDVGIAGDWNGDGIDTTGVFRPSNGFLFLKNANSTGFADIALNYGLPGDRPVTGDWNNDGVDTIGVYRNGTFYLRNSNSIGFADLIFALGIPGDMPIAGNWDGLP